MSLRYYLAPLTGDGSDESPFRPSLPEDALGWASLIPTDEKGQPRLEWVLCLVDGDHEALAKEASLIQLLAPDEPMSSLPSEERDEYAYHLTQNGFDISIDWQRDTAADVVDKLARVAEPTWERGGMTLDQDTPERAMNASRSR